MESRVMNLLENKEFLRGLLKQSDLLNTINGGVSLTAVNVLNTEDGIVIKVSAPSVPVEAFQIILDNKNLSIYSELRSSEEEENDEVVKVPMFIRTFEVPSVIDTDHIEAYYESGELRVILPFKDKERLQKFITIKVL